MGGRNILVCTQLVCAYRGKDQLLCSPPPFKCFLAVLDLGQHQLMVRGAESPELFEVYWAEIFEEDDNFSNLNKPNQKSM